MDLLFWIYLTNAVILINHEIDSAFWQEWKLINPKQKNGIAERKTRVQYADLKSDDHRDIRGIDISDCIDCDAAKRLMHVVIIDTSS
jgi:hypothetical protein